MKKIAKIILIVLVASLTLSLFSCDIVDTIKNVFMETVEDVEEAIDSIGAYTFSDIVLTQDGVNSFKIDFTPCITFSIPNGPFSLSQRSTNSLAL